MNLEIVPYEEALKNSLFEFTGECFRKIGKAFEPDGRHSFYNDIPGSFDSFWCLVEGSVVLGSVAIKEIGDGMCELKALYLSEVLRGQGWGYKLLDTAVSYARATGYKRVVLDSMSQYKDARRLYDRYGFTVTDRYNDNIYADVFMEYVL